jgi:hypothetical protein
VIASDRHLCPPGGERPLTEGEIALAAAMFGPALDPSQVMIRRKRWFPLQPRTTVMAPCGHIHFHPRGSLYRDDFSAEAVPLQALFIHEMTHVWQAQMRGKWYLPFARHPFCRYRYVLKPGKPFGAYGIEQQAEIVAHAFRARIGGVAHDELEAILPF